jgi:serine-type D-Ala-D-Ala endopeptidase (penicillin-binding protein 7)
MGRIKGWAQCVVALTALAVGSGGALAPVTAAAATTSKTATAKSAQKSNKQKSKSTAKKSQKAKPRKAAPAAPPRMSYGQMMGLHSTPDPLSLKSSVALVVDQDTDEVLFSKNPHAVLPIASITKLMTALVVTEAQQPLDQVLTVTQDDVDTEKGSHSRLRVGTQLTRAEMLHLALMSSENRAAHALGRNYPGGLPSFVNAMNRKAQQLGMTDTRYVDPTGLSSANQSSARDLAVLVKAAYEYDSIRSSSTSPLHYVAIGPRDVRFKNSNKLVYSPEWAIGLQKTGYIVEAGRCLVMQAELAGRKLIMVLLDSTGTYTRIADAERLRHWLTGDVNPATFVMPPS